MRTTLTLDDDVAERLAREARKQNVSFKEIVNATLRRGFNVSTKPNRQSPVVTKPHVFKSRARVLDRNFNHLIDELEIEDHLVKNRDWIEAP